MYIIGGLSGLLVGASLDLGLSLQEPLGSILCGALTVLGAMIGMILDKVK